MSGVNNEHRARRGRMAIWQAKLMLLVMINLAQLWILSATIDAALAEEDRQLLPLISASLACWIISMTIVVWWRPAMKPVRD